MKILDISKFKEMLIGGATLLEINKDYVDSLNVFPVPDGDTGTNMSKTLTSAVSEVDSKDYDNFEDLLTDFSKGALKGARGNSGVILSQIVKGISKSLSEAKTINTHYLKLLLNSNADNINQYFVHTHTSKHFNVVFYSAFYYLYIYYKMWVQNKCGEILIFMKDFR
mgnify:CR=1 FL=1